MKKYEKPGLYVEALDAKVITGSCNYAVSSPNSESTDPGTIFPGQEPGEPAPAPFPVGGGVMMFVSAPTCHLTPENMGIQVCYHGFDPHDQNNVYDSR
ncbi:MAG: hypothetical protein IKI64_07170 [Clostridia bacterium]|nr:hypothetical protein [Clostridia bacterium]